MTIPNHYIWLYQDKSILYMVKWVEGEEELNEEGVWQQDIRTAGQQDREKPKKEEQQTEQDEHE